MGVCVCVVGGMRVSTSTSTTPGGVSVWRGLTVAVATPERPPRLIISLSLLEIFIFRCNW